MKGFCDVIFCKELTKPKKGSIQFFFSRKGVKLYSLFLPVQVRSYKTNEIYSMKNAIAYQAAFR